MYTTLIFIAIAIVLWVAIAVIWGLVVWFSNWLLVICLIALIMTLWSTFKLTYL